MPACLPALAGLHPLTCTARVRCDACGGCPENQGVLSRKEIAKLLERDKEELARIRVRFVLLRCLHWCRCRRGWVVCVRVCEVCL